LGQERTFDAQTGQLVWSGNIGPDPFEPSFGFGGKTAVISDNARQARLFSVDKGVLGLIRSYPEAQTAFFMPDGQEVCVTYWDARLYDTRAELDVPIYDLGRSSCLEISKDGHLWSATTAESTTLDLKSGQLKTQNLGGLYLDEIRADTGCRVWFRLSGTKMTIVDGETGRTLLDIAGVDRSSAFQPCEMSPDGRLVAVMRTSSSIDVYDLKLGKHIGAAVLHANGRTIAFSPDSELLLCGDESGTLSAFSIDKLNSPMWTMVDNPMGMQSIPIALSFSPTGDQFAVARGDDRAAIVDVSTRKITAYLEGNSQTVCCIAWSPDGSRVAAGSADHTVRLWDSKTGRELGIVGQHEQTVLGVRFLPGGKTLASASIDGIVKLWMTADGR
jgi:WD40 repeat protein